jgi:hypothetical protein
MGFNNERKNFMKLEKLINKLINYLFIIPLLATLWGCSGGSTGTGTVSVGLTDSSTDQYQAVYVTVSEIQVNQSADGEETESSWVTIGTPNQTYNLLDLVNGVRETLGLADVQAGHYTQMRLILGDTPDGSINILSQAHPFANYVIDLAGTVHELTVPSGMQTGIKIVQGFDISASETTELVLDFDAGESVVIAGNSGRYLLKPTIRVLETAEASIISGAVTKSADDSVLAGATVSAQVFDDTATDDKDRVIVEASTITDADGHFSLFLSPGTYNLVFYEEGYQASASEITVAAGDTVTQNAALDATTTGTLTATTTISGADDETYATLSLRQSATIDGNAEEVELFALNIADGGMDSVTLPAGEVIVVSSSFGVTTQSIPATITADAETVLNIDL